MPGLLTDRRIKEYIKRGRIKIDPFEKSLVGPASYDVRLGFRFRVFKGSDLEVIDIKSFEESLKGKIEEKDRIIERYKYSDVVILKSPENPFIIHPNEFVLASIYEYIELPPNIAAQIQGRSSIARLGLLVHTSAGWVDPGYKGHLTLEIVNVNKVPVKLYPLTKIAQLQFFELEEDVEIPYSQRKLSKYIGEEGATESRIKLDFSDSNDF